jgi:hypothetical protein
MLDRSGPLYRAVYNQRTACERFNSQAKELGIEPPNVRNGRSVANLNTLIYLVINVRTIERATSINSGLLSIQKGFRYMNDLHPSLESTKPVVNACLGQLRSALGGESRRTFLISASV